MAILIKANGEVSEVNPAEGQFTLEEMHKYVGGYIEIRYPHQLMQGRKKLNGVPCEIGPKTHMVVNESGKPLRLPLNHIATALYQYGHIDEIVGDVLLAEYGRDFD